MFEQSEIKKAVKNSPGQNFLWFGNRIVNLSHVKEIDSGFESDTRKIIFKYADGSSYETSCNSHAMHSKSWRMISHCLKNGLFFLELTEECHAKWAGYERSEK